MRAAIEYFVKYPILANIIVLLTVITGGAAMYNTHKSYFPKQPVRNIIVQVAYPGASPQEMEEGVTLKIEEAVYSIQGIDEINSTSSENIASIDVKTLSGYDIDEVYADVKNAVDRIGSFPSGAERPILFKQKPQARVLSMGLTGDVDLLTLKKFADLIEDELLASGNISQMQISGFPPREIAIEISEENLSRYGFTFDQITAAVRANNRDISAGAVKSGEEEILIRSNGKDDDAEKIGEIELRSDAKGAKILLRDVASIREQFSETPVGAKLNGKQSVFFQIDKLEEEDLQLICEYLAVYIEKFNAKYPEVHLQSTFSFFDRLKERLNMLLSNGLTGMILVFLALSFFLNTKLSFWVAWGIPSAFCGMFLLGGFTDLSINMISLFGMLVVVGILVDDGIVISENIYTHFERHGNAKRAAVEGTLEVLPSVFTSVITTIVAFMPLLFLEGTLSFFSDLGLVVILSLSFSMIEAVFVLPSHLASESILRKSEPGTFRAKARGFINGLIDFVGQKIYGTALKASLNYKGVSIGLLFALFPIVIGLLGGDVVKTTFFPNIPGDRFNVNIAFKPGTSEEIVIKYLDGFEKSLWEMNDELKKQHREAFKAQQAGTAEFKNNIQDDTLDYITFSVSTLGATGDNSATGSHAGNISVFHRETDDTPIPSSLELIAMLRQKIGPVPEADKFSIGGQSRFGKPIAVQMLGKNIEELEGAKTMLKQGMDNMSELKDVQDNLAVGRREMQMELTPKAHFMGLTEGEISRQLRQGFFGEEVQRLQKGTDEVRVWVRYPRSGRQSVGQVEKVKIKVPGGREFPVSELVTFNTGRGVASIKHFNAARTVTVESDLTDPYAAVPPILDNIKNHIIPEIQAKYPGVTFDFAGQSRESAKSQDEIKKYFGAALAVIFVILMISFKSFYQALLIFLMIPVGWAVAVFGHWIEGLPVSIFSVWGMVALSGVIVNDAVVFLDKYNSNLKNGMAVKEAVFDAGLSRFRAILLTSITTVLGLFPLIRETSFQAQFLIPMAVSVAYGIMFGTVVILLFFPALILLANDLRVYYKWLITGKRPAPEQVENAILEAEREKMFEVK